MSASASSLAGYTAVKLGRLLRNGEVDAREPAEYFIGRIENCADPAVFISTCFERARREAEESAARYRAGVRHLAAAGMVTLGKTNLSEFAYSALGLNPHFGTPHNPNAHDQTRVPSGSSSGSGVSVAAGLVPVAIGTDTGSSVRTPAAFNGVVGFKTSEGRISNDGVFPTFGGIR